MSQRVERGWLGVAPQPELPGVVPVPVGSKALQAVWAA